MIADIVSGKTALADTLFLVAAILFGLATVVLAVARPLSVHMVLTTAGLCIVAIAWLVL